MPDPLIEYTHPMKVSRVGSPIEPHQTDHSKPFEPNETWPF